MFDIYCWRKTFSEKYFHLVRNLTLFLCRLKKYVGGCKRSFYKKASIKQKILNKRLPKKSPLKYISLSKGYFRTTKKL